ncbi:MULTISPECIES: adaptor protein MecA [unclassified Rummeliibacillus]|uniref:adaptor protein MecA n=1 Tax=unclassified Rummeliibacillus TaxID=2622809 RepID=UPI000E6701F0|nr:MULTISPECIES: adaptor protein MecA [unclassified Rummeliibacillus]RIJ67659.1 adaptor protein MecA [Rummeliibacillus sp. POC4]RPJ96223.1 adaptor protein MecA [Rummeliibacillus sp. TYF005]
MDMERINENTLKLFISYLDIEERGFTKDEIWYNREKGEELFWVMMEEINDDIDFEMDGPLWIQVVAKENGLELTVTTAKLNSDGLLDLPSNLEDKRKFFENAFSGVDIKPDEFNEFFGESDEIFDGYTFELNQFDDIIDIAYRMPKEADFDNSLYEMDGKFYLHVEFDEDCLMGDLENYLSVISEFADEADKTIHVLEEYGKVIMEENCFENVRKYF